MKIPKGHPYRKQVRNGPVVQRGTTASRQGSRSRRSSSASNAGQDGSRVLWAIILLGGVVASGFLLALQSQGKVRRLGRQDAELKAEFHELAKQQRFDDDRRRQAIDEVQRKTLANAAARGLIQPALQRAALPSPLAARMVAASQQSGITREKGSRVVRSSPARSASSSPASTFRISDGGEVSPRPGLRKEPAVVPVVQTRTAPQTRPRRIEAVVSEQ
jgi:hypothetical protein